VIVYGPTPPEGVITTDPFDPPLQDTLVIAVVAVIGVAWVMVTVAVVVQPLASVTVTVYDPATRPVAVAVVCTGVVFQE